MENSSSQAANDPVPWSQWWGMTVIATLILAGLEYMVYASLAPLERGEPQGTAVWEPIAIVYELGGFALAMSVIPAMWVCLMSIVAWQTWLRIKSERGT